VTMAYRTHIRRRFRAAWHELHCLECRVTWTSWCQRLMGDGRGYTPKVLSRLGVKSTRA
jgi:hypothetical protein